MFNIVLCQPQIPPNTGNIARLCVATKARLHLVRPLGFFLDDKTMRRAGCDYWEHLEWEIHDSFTALREWAGKANFYFASKRGKRDYYDCEFVPGDYLVFGSEEDGLPAELLAAEAKQTTKIPMPGATRSLNLANSVAIILYEALRQNRDVKA